jgi:hypothetical protein
MWPFKKKADMPETTKSKIDPEDLKPKTAGKIIFNVEATRRMIENKASEARKELAPDDPKPIHPGEKLECPFCNQLIEKYSRRGKCPLCKNWVYFFNGRLYSQEDSQRVKNEFYTKRYQNRAAGEALSGLGFTEEMIQRREQEMAGTSGMKTSRASVFMSLFNESILKVRNMLEKERLYMEAARTLNRMGEDSFHLQKAAALSRLAWLKQKKFTEAYILSMNNCDACRALDGKVMTIEEAKKTLPIPIREGCTNRCEGDKYSICVCYYEGAADDEYIMRTLDD